GLCRGERAWGGCRLRRSGQADDGLRGCGEWNARGAEGDALALQGAQAPALVGREYSGQGRCFGRGRQIGAALEAVEVKNDRAIRCGWRNASGPELFGDVEQA